MTLFLGIWTETADGSAQKKDRKMVSRLDMDGMTRVAAAHLARRNPRNRSEALDLLVRSFSAYDVDPLTLEAGVDQYFQTRQG